MAVPQNVARQERILAEAQMGLDRIEKMREQMIKRVEAEAKRLSEMREQQGKFFQSPGTEPNLSTAAPASFQSQFDQFNTTKSNERLKPIGNDSLLDFSGKLAAPKEDTPFYRTSDRDEHWASVIQDPGKPMFVSGRYVSSEHGSNAIDNLGEYEYELSTRALPVSVGDILRVPVHPTGHGDGKAFSTGHLQYQITDIYSTPKFNKYHDRIDG